MAFYSMEKCVECCVVVIAWVVSAIKLGFHGHSRDFFSFFVNITKSDLQPVF